VTDEWTDEEFSRVHNRLRLYEYGIDMTATDLDHLRTCLMKRRGDLAALPESDLEHLAGDIRRFYGMPVQQWLD